MKKLLMIFTCSLLMPQELLNETIVFESANPFSFEEIISCLTDSLFDLNFSAIYSKP